MRKWRPFIVRGAASLVVLVSSTACYEGDPSGPIACTEQFVYGLAVTVRDQSTALPKAEDATLTLRDGAHVEVVTDSWDGTTLVGAGERPGTYDVTVEHPGYETWIRAGVEITEDECHVIPVTITADLIPVP
jgi:hypothetical protein